MILPAAIRYQTELAQNVATSRRRGSTPDTTLLEAVSAPIAELTGALPALEAAPWPPSEGSTSRAQCTPRCTASAGDGWRSGGCRHAGRRCGRRPLAAADLPGDAVHPLTARALHVRGPCGGHIERQDPRTEGLQRLGSNPPGGLRVRVGAPPDRARQAAGVDQGRGSEGRRAVRGSRRCGQGRCHHPHHRGHQPPGGAGGRARHAERPRRTQWYFQRYAEQLPAAGEMVLFDRSWYNRGVERVMGFANEDEVEEFMRSCPQFEGMLQRSGHHPRQVLVLGQRRGAGTPLPGPDGRPDETLEAVADGHRVPGARRTTPAKDEMFAYTDTKQSPWWVVDGEDKRTRTAQLHQPPAADDPLRGRHRAPAKLPAPAGAHRAADAAPDGAPVLRARQVLSGRIPAMHTELPPLFHLALADEWLQAVERAGPTSAPRSGLGLDQVGFIHCSFADQVALTRDQVLPRPPGRRAAAHRSRPAGHRGARRGPARHG